MKSNRAWVVALAIALMASAPAFAPALHAQMTSGSIIGTISDPSGAVVPGAKVSVKNQETGIARETTTNASGAYQFPELPPGLYTVEATAKGFAPHVQSAISVTVGATVPVNVALTLGAATQVVKVSGGASMVNTTNASMGGLEGEHEVRELPLNGRDWFQLATLQAGVIGGAGPQPITRATNSRAARGNGLPLNISGNRQTNNLFTVEGLIVNDNTNASPGSGLNVNLGVEAIREFRVITDNAPAQYGRATGGIVTAVFKSGTNQYHGSIFEFHRNDELDARDPFEATRSEFRRHQFGGSVGGPIPKLKNTFFFFDDEELREVQGIAHSSDTLSPQARLGMVCADAACTSRNQITIADSVKPYLALFPPANGPVNGDSAKFIFSGPEIGNEQYNVTKVDHSFSANTTLSASVQFDTATEAQPDAYDQKLIGSPSRHLNVVAALQHIFSPTLLMTLRAGVARSHITDSEDTTALIPQVTDKSLSFLPQFGFPVGNLGVAGLTGTAGGLGGSGQDVENQTVPQWSGDVTWIKGRHTVQFGVQVQNIEYNKNSSVGAPFGEFDFDSVPQFLQGIPSSFTVDLPQFQDIRGLRQWYWGAYVQDAINVRPNLHVSVGLRYEHFTPIGEQFGRVAVLPTPSSPAPRTGGDFFHTTVLDFSPRIAVAWDPFGTGKTSIRAGYGIYDFPVLPYLLENLTNSVPFFEDFTSTQSPLPASSFPTGGLALVTENPKFRTTYIEPFPHRPYVQEYNLTVQRQLTSNMLLTVGYVGSHGVHLPRIIADFDVVPLSLVTFAPNGQLLFPTTGPIQRINPNFSRIAGDLFDDTSSYNGFVVDFVKRFSGGLHMGSSFTWGKSIDYGSATFSGNELINSSGVNYTYYRPGEKGVSDFDITRRFVLDYVWDVPGTSSFRGVKGALLKGWEFGGIFTAQSGLPFVARLSADRARTGDNRARSSDGGQRPNVVPGCKATNPDDPNHFLNLSCFTFPPLGELGNEGRNSLRGPGLLDFDLSIFKNWGFLGERMHLQFRTEMFNVLNRPNFQEPKIKVFNGSGKPILSNEAIPSPTATSARQIQFGLKLSF